MSGVYIRSIGMTDVGEHWERSLVDLAVEAVLKTMEEARWPTIDLMIVANMMAGRLLAQNNLGTFIASEAGLSGVRSMRMEAAHASGGVAIATAYSLIRSGTYRNVLVVGVEKTRDVLAEDAVEALSTSEDAEYTLMTGANIYTIAGILTKLYLARYSARYEDLVFFPVIAHANAVNSPHAQFRREISVKHVLNSPMISDPVRLLDSPPLSDGAAALLMSEDPSGSIARVTYSDYTTSTLRFYSQDDPLSIPTLRSSIVTLREGGIEIEKADFVELHDTFSVLAAMTLEELGLADAGRAAEQAANGRFDLDGELPISTFGGMKARGFPAGASGVYQVAEAAMQVSGNAGKNQVQDAKLGIAVNLSGFGSTASLTAVEV